MTTEAASTTKKKLRGLSPRANYTDRASTTTTTTTTIIITTTTTTTTTTTARVAQSQS